MTDTLGGPDTEARHFYKTLSNAVTGRNRAWSHYHVVAGLQDAVTIVVQTDTEHVA